MPNGSSPTLSTDLAAFELAVVLRPPDVGVRHRTANLTVHGVLAVGHELFRLDGDVNGCGFHCVGGWVNDRKAVTI